MEEICCPNKDCHDYDPLTTDNCIKCYTLDQLIPMSDPPSEPGWYWFKGAGYNDWLMVHVRHVPRGLQYLVYTGGYMNLLHDFEDAQWQGPIKEPTAAQSTRSRKV